MKFEEGNYYTHPGFLDVFFKVLTNFNNDSMFVSWYNKRMVHNPDFIGTDVITIKNHEHWSKYDR